MSGGGRRVLLLAVACLAGVGAGELLYRSAPFRGVLAPLLGRGELLALVHGVGIYEHDRPADSEFDVKALLAAENLRRFAQEESVSGLETEMSRLRWQFADEKAFGDALVSSALSTETLRHRVSEHLQGRAWVEKQIASELRVTDDECRQFYEANRDQFQQPARWRVSHIFLAAHEGVPAPDVEAKRKAIEALGTRLGKGESLAQLATEISEDEATKLQGGDLGYFSATRVPPEFLAAVEKLQIGQITSPFQSYLGFHIAQLTDEKSERPVSFEEVRGEIATFLANQKRADAVARLNEKCSVADFLRPAP